MIAWTLITQTNDLQCYRMHRSLKLTILLVALSLVSRSGIAGEVTHASRIKEVTDVRFDSFLQDMMKHEHFTGVALVMRDGKILHAKGYGEATAGAANTIDTKFHVGSITKQFTAAAIMRLVEKGSVKLDGSINTYLPRRYRSPKWNAVTIHHVLSHTSGIPDYAVTRDYYQVVKGFCLGDTVDGMVKEAMGKELEFASGSKFSYSNLGYTLLGFVIENQANTSYDQYIKQNVLDPMGMASSSIHAIGHVPAKDEAAGFRWSEEQGKHVQDDVVSLPVTAPDGGLITTLSDFVMWARIFTHADQTVLNQGSIKRMSTPVIGIGAGGPLDSMGYGLYAGDRLIAHGGLIVGFSSQFVYDRETRSLIVVFTNNTTNNPQKIAFGLLTILLTPSP
jgi:D-alanyl-D-alanine carboxypeptidase